eukprot:2497814-Prymnesium_polylepis.2
MQAALAAAEAGAAASQCTSTLCVFLLHFGRPGSDEVESSVMRGNVMLWLALLVASSMLRGSTPTSSWWASRQW